MRIHCIEMQKEGFDKIPYKELLDMVGYVEAPEKEGETWDVTLSDGSFFACESQETAQLMSGIEEVKALLMQKD